MSTNLKLVGDMRFPVGPTESIVMDEMGVDDVAIQPVEMFRLERMSKSSFFSCTYAPDGSGRHVFWFYAKKGKLTVEHRWEGSPGMAGRSGGPVTVTPVLDNESGCAFVVPARTPSRVGG